MVSDHLQLNIFFFSFYARNTREAHFIELTSVMCAARSTAGGGETDLGGMSPDIPDFGAICSAAAAVRVFNGAQKMTCCGE